MEKKMQVLLITSHVWGSKRKAGFHWIADACHRRGYDVFFFTGLSLIDVVKRDYRVPFIARYGVNRLYSIGDRLSAFINFTIFRPVGFRGNKFLNWMSSLFFYLYRHMPLSKAIRHVVLSSDLIVFESVNEILLFDKMKKINPGARYVYRMSDDMSIRNVHPLVLSYERGIASEFDLVSVPTKSMYDKFIGLSNCRLQLHGLPLHLYEVKSINPYPSGSLNAVYAGNNSFDKDFLRVAAEHFPSVNFYIFGNVDFVSSLPNVKVFGEVAYEKIVPYIKNADIGLSPMLNSSFSDSNKIIQYVYSGLPVIISDLNRCDRDSFFYYSIGDVKSIISAMSSAISSGRRKGGGSGVRSWDDLVDDLFKDPAQEKSNDSL